MNIPTTFHAHLRHNVSVDEFMTLLKSHPEYVSLALREIWFITRFEHSEKLLFHFWKYVCSLRPLTCEEFYKMLSTGNVFNHIYSLAEKIEVPNAVSIHVKTPTTYRALCYLCGYINDDTIVYDYNNCDKTLEIRSIMEDFKKQFEETADKENIMQILVHSFMYQTMTTQIRFRDHN